MVKYIHLIPLFPFLAFAINIVFGRRLKKISALLAISACVISFVLSVLTFLSCANGNTISYTFIKWLDFKNTSLDFGVMADPLSCMMLLVVSIVGILVQIYSVSYMRNDTRFSRYFAYISLFMASMLALVLADNFIMFYICWEAVGLCSYLLISFWFERASAAKAGLKAFITTRIGDTGLFIGILILFSLTGTFNFNALAQHTSGNGAMFGVAAVLIFCGAAGKSAQFPLHVWLPDAMEGPTPVSALIHAATMVAAGVYLIARVFWLFLGNQPALMLVACIGAATAFFAASIATVQNDLKKILAYSTISQLGFMMMGLGVGGYSEGTFHLMTHAFGKALLFLCAGNVIHTARTLDIRRMGGLFSKLKITGITFIIAGSSISGLPPFSGFWSKDDIILETLHSGHPFLFSLSIITSLLTAFYIFRMIFLVFFAKACLPEHAKESLSALTWPLIILAFFAVFAGFLGSPFMNYAFQKFFYSGGGHALVVTNSDYFMMVFLACVSLAGILVAYSFYVLNNKILPLPLRAKFSGLYNILYNKYYLDEIYEFLFIKPCLRIANAVLKFDANFVIEGTVNIITRAVSIFSRLLRAAQTGFISNYLLAALLGVLFMVVIKSAGIKICVFQF